MAKNKDHCSGCGAATYQFHGKTRCESCGGELLEHDHRRRTGTAEPVREPSNRARMVSDGGRVSVPVLGDVHPGLLLGGSLVGLAVLRAVSGGPDPVDESDDSAEIETTAEGELQCPECGEACSRQGIQGHLRWKHDKESEEIEEALPG